MYFTSQYKSVCMSVWTEVDNLDMDGVGVDMDGVGASFNKASTTVVDVNRGRWIHTMVTPCPRQDGVLVIVPMFNL